MRKNVVIVAGGKGLRMGKDIPKQFIPIGFEANKKPILMHTIELFSDIVDKIILVLPEAHLSYWDELCKLYNFNCNHTISIGGETRFHSVSSGLKHTDEGSLVAIHDAVRPFVSKRLILKLFECAKFNDSAIPYISVIDSLRSVDEYMDKSSIVDRNRYVCIQTPQVFKQDIITQAYKTDFDSSFTDDASVYEFSTGKFVSLVEGERKNIKITTSLDLDIAELFVKKTNL